MTIIKRLFAEKIIRYYERIGRLKMLSKHIPGAGDIVSKQLEENDNLILKHIVGAVLTILSAAYMVIKKFVFVLTFIWFPYKLIAARCPLVAEQKSLAIVYLFTLICTFCGTITNNVVSVVNKRDYMMTRVVLISPVMNFLGKLICKMFTDAVCFTIVLHTIGLGFAEAMVLSLTAACLRPLGELFAICMYQKSKILYNNKGMLYGVFMALGVIVGYGCMYVTRSVSGVWSVMTSPLTAAAALVLGAVSLVILCNIRVYSDMVDYAVTKLCWDGGFNEDKQEN